MVVPFPSSCGNAAAEIHPPSSRPGLKMGGGKQKPAPKKGNRPAHKSGSKPNQTTKQARRGKQQPEDEEPAPPPKDETPPAQKPAHQQKLLRIFQESFHAILNSGSFFATIQEVKTALFNRDFDKAFGREDYLEAYAARWSPTRALCYASILDGIRPHLDEMIGRSIEEGDEEANDDGAEEVVLQILAIGGAAAEVVALGSYVNLNWQPPSVAASVKLVDVAPWGQVVDKLRTGLVTPPQLSEYASRPAREANRALVEPSRLKEVAFQQLDVLALDRDAASPLVATSAPRTPVLATLLFTLNELFTAGGLGKTTTFLLTLTSALPPGSLLLVVDSPGSYSETTVGKEAKRYPMQWLLDKILLQTEEGEETAMWDKVEEKESEWFRLGQGLRYAIPLEDMRYQMHLYRRGGGGGEGSDVDTQEGVQ